MGYILHSQMGIYYIVGGWYGGGMEGGRISTTPYHPLYIFLCPCPNMISKQQQMWLKWGIYSIPRWVYIILLGGGMGVVWRVVELIPPPYNPPVYFCLPTPNKIIKEQQMLHIRVWHANHRNMILWLMRPLGVLLPKELVP
jgi:hypothetical protein